LSEAENEKGYSFKRAKLLNSFSNNI